MILKKHFLVKETAILWNFLYFYVNQQFQAIES